MPTFTPGASGRDWAGATSARWTSERFNAEMGFVPRTASLNVLLWYIHRPGSDFYLVYNQGFETAVPGPRDLRTRGRSLAIKVTYWLSR